jgi:CBS domain-containing protein
VLSLLHPAEMACELLKLPLGRHRVAERLAAYRVVALPVIDSAGRLVGAVTIDDVLDRLLPRGWRLSQEAG